MTLKKCRVTRREIDQSELNQPLGDQVRAHLASCAPCREFRDERARLRELVGSLEPVTAPADFDVRLRARIATQRQSNARRPFLAGFSVSTPALAVAAVVIMCAASIVWFAQRNRNQAPTVVSGTPGPMTPPKDNSKVVSQETRPTLAAGTNPMGVTKGMIRDRSFSSRVTGRKAIQPVLAKGTGNLSRDFSVAPARSIKQSNTNAGEVSLSAPVKPLVVSLEDDRGATRKISLPPVSFGSQRLIDNLASTTARIW
jgi:hypothetical protein